MGRRRRSRWPLGSGQLARAGGHGKDFLKIFARAVVAWDGWEGAVVVVVVEVVVLVVLEVVVVAVVVE